MTIYLKDVLPISKEGDYKIHFARYSQEGKNYPLDAWVSGESKWQEWQEFRPKSNHFNLPYIFSLMEFHHESDTWLFGGVFEVLARHKDRYEVKLTDMGKGFIGRLKIKYRYKARPVRVKMEPHYRKFEVKEILSERYTGRPFPGFEEIDLSFQELKALIDKDRVDWKTALENAKGVYLLTDTKTNKRYVGSAYGDKGVWSRWEQYIKTGHGGNVEIEKLMKKDGTKCCESFRFALLEHRSPSTSDEKIQSREKYWKDILNTRGEGGFNRN